MRVGFAVAAALFATSAAATDGAWFENSFGEQRAYFGAWLAVCDNSGTGQCRLVQESASDAPDSSYFRVAMLLLEDDEEWVMEVTQRGMPADQLTGISFTIDGKVTSAPEGSWKVGENAVANVAETITVIAPGLMESLLTGMRDGANMRIEYVPPGSGLGSIPVSLSGVTAGTAAVLANYAAR